MLEKISRQTRKKDRLLYTLEAGRVAQIMGYYGDSEKWFQQAADLYEKNDEAARIRVSSLSQSVTAIAINDNFIHYQAQPYERILSYTFQALNYLAQGDIVGAAVEFRRVDYTQRQQELDHQKQITKAEEKNKGKDSVGINEYEGYFSGLNSAAALVRSGIQNAYSYYLAAAFWEGQGLYNDALVDYKQALQILPDSDFIKADVQRASHKLNGQVNKNGLLIIALEQGFVPTKEPVRIPIPTDQGIVIINFPVYQINRLSDPLPMQVKVNKDEITTQPLINVGAIAAHALKEQLSSIIARQIARTAAKYTIQREVNESLGLLGSYAIQLYNFVSEQADLRSWMTLPANSQVARLELAAGTYEVGLSLSGSHANLVVPISVQGVTLLRVIDLGGRLITQTMPINGGS
ncbi:hypothetical conserved protein [Candidatus Nitrosoglobus terrae]|uniref:Hypothetical conserved protein n=1 Tax=Candidatus Nitrosoglobus terrae TaxID=1630141 RepID=A0A1Q2SL82_9GAMM|nr:hypothetical conserved protein [Candidatus Nitrosoglobus terrae]